MSEQYKEAMRRVYDEVFNTGDLDRFDEFVTEDFVEHERLPPVRRPAGKE